MEEEHGAAATAATASTENSTSRRAAAAEDAKVMVCIGDDSHKLALVAQHTSEAAFGKNPGIGANHHVQHMYTDYYVRTNDKLNYATMANTFMDNRKGLWLRTPPQPLTSRWGYVGLAAIHHLALRSMKNQDGEPFVATFYTTMFEDEKRPKKQGEGGTYKVNAWDCLGVAYMDPRIVTGITFEAEYYELVMGKLMAWNRAHSRQGFRAGFRIMDIAERVHFDERPWWEGAVTDFGAALPCTAAALDGCAAADRAELSAGLRNGLRAGKAEHDKLYGYLDEPFGVVLLMFCRGRSGCLVRLVLAAFVRIHVVSATTVAGVAEPTGDDLIDPLSTKLSDNEFARTTWAYWRHWNLDSASLVGSFVELSQNMETEREDDTITDSFVRGEGTVAVELYEHSCVAIAPCPHSCARVELLFSLRKQIEENNESKAMVDMIMMYMENTVNVMRDERRALNATWKRAGHKKTAEQVALACRQMLEHMKCYAWDRMKDLPGRRRFSDKLTGSDVQVAQRHREMLRTRREESRRVARTAEQWRERAAAFAERPTVQQAASRIVDAVTVYDRRFAVLREVAFPGQTGRSKAFWTALGFQPTSTLWAEARLALPLLVGAERLRGTGGALEPKRKSTRAGWHEVGRRPVTKAYLTAHIKAHVTAMFTGTPDETKRDAHKCDLCSKDGEPVWHHGGVACMLGDHDRHNFLLVALNFYGAGTQLALTATERTADGATAHPGGPPKPTTPKPPLRHHFINSPPPPNRRDPCPLAFAIAPNPPPEPPPADFATATETAAEAALPPPPHPPPHRAPTPPAPRPPRAPRQSRAAPAAPAPAAARAPNPYAREFAGGGKRQRTE